VKRILLLIIFVQIFSVGIYCGGRYDYFYGNIYNDHIKGKIDSIVETIIFQRDGIPNIKFITESTLKYEYLGKGLIIVTTDNIKKTEIREMSDNSYGQREPAFVNIYYNEYYNNDIISNDKLNYNIELISFITFDKNRYNLNIKNNNIEIILENEISSKKVTLRFDRKTKRLATKSTEVYSREWKSGRMIKTYTDNILYEYDGSGRLMCIYSNSNEEKILKKSIYYDGILEPRIPDYKELYMQKIDEIIICAGDRLKYRVLLRKIHENSQIETPSFYTIIFYDEKMNQIEQFSKDMMGEEERYEINNIMIDSYNNPIHIEYIMEFSRFDDPHNFDNFYYDIKRDITYK
jgi:hypothetical protein